MDVLQKSAVVRKAAELDEGELALINAQTLRDFTPEEVFTFKLAACDTAIDRDFERFTDEALEQMAALYPGRPVLRDHDWSSGSQTARVYAAGVEDNGDRKQLVLRCYMPRTVGTADTITAIESGVMRECSVGLSVGKSICSICGADQRQTICKHIGGREYDGQPCHFDLDDVRDIYEISLCAVPAQPDAKVIKAERYGGKELPADNAQALRRAKSRLELEKIRYGGNRA